MNLFSTFVLLTSNIKAQLFTAFKICIINIFLLLTSAKERLLVFITYTACTSE